MHISNLLRKIAAQYRLDPAGMHGPSHWGRVLQNGLRLSGTRQADNDVVTLFAIFHDACRWNEDVDPEHGPRASILIDTFLSETRLLKASQRDLLKEACELHTRGHIIADVTIQTCWDADRLDIERVGIVPSKWRLCTQPAKNGEMIDWASERARGHLIPDFVENEWMPIFMEGWEKNSLSG